MVVIVIVDKNIPSYFIFLHVQMLFKLMGHFEKEFGAQSLMQQTAAICGSNLSKVLSLFSYSGVSLRLQSQNPPREGHSCSGI